MSIVIPAHNEERRLPATLAAVEAWSARQAEPVEILVVENGSSDRTADLARAFAGGHPSVRVIDGLPRGKGSAVKTGILEARGALRFLCDADLSMPIEQIDRFVAAVNGGAAVAIGSREAPGARRIGEPAYRHLMGRVFNQVVKLLAVPGIEDTQCGSKMFTAAAAEDVFRSATLTGLGFDPEILYIARKRGYSIREVPVDWYYDADSRVRRVHDSVAMVRDLLHIRWNDLTGAYDV